MLLVYSGQFNRENFKFVNFPDLFGDATTVALYLNISVLPSAPIVKKCLKIYSKFKTFFAKFCFLK